MVAAAGASEMTRGQRAELERLARSHTAPAREVRQAKALLWATDGVSNAEIARRCASTPKSVRRRRSRFAAEGTAAVGRIRAGRGRPVVLGDDVVEAIVHDTLQRYGSRGGQGPLREAEVVAAQQQLHPVGPTRGSRHEDAHHGAAGAAARSIVHVSAWPRPQVVGRDLNPRCGGPKVPAISPAQRRNPPEPGPWSLAGRRRMS